MKHHVLLAGFLAILVAGCGGTPSPRAESTSAPEFSGTTLQGETISFTPSTTRPTLLVFWSSW